MDPVELLALLGGVAERHALVGRYKTRPVALARAVTEGRILRVRRGCYALPGADPVRVAQIAWRALPTCITAARALELPVMTEDQRLHLQTVRERSFSGRNLRPPSNIRMHYVNSTPERLLTVAEVLDSVGHCLPQEQHLVLVDAALNRRMLLLGDITGFSTTSKRRAEWLARHADPRTESGIETLLRLAMRRAGLRVESQAVIEGVGRVDFLVEGRVIVEADGRNFHSDPVSFASDRRRDRAAVALGLPVLRFTYAEIVGDSAECARQVREVTDLKAHSGPKSRKI